jgi:hypothetical protein
MSAAIPSLARADGWRDDHRFDHRERYVERDFDRDIPLRDMPRDVMRTIDRERRGGPIEAVQFVHRDGKYFYRLRIDTPGRDDLNFRINPAGRVLSIQEVEECDPGYVSSRHDWRR